MDLILLLGIATALLVILLCTLLFTRKSSKESKDDSKPAAGPSRRINHGEAVDSSIPRRAQIVRNQRRNVAQPATSHPDSEEESDGESNQQNPFAGEKMGTKKRAKLEAKAEKRQQREAEMLAREVCFHFNCRIFTNENETWLNVETFAKLYKFE